MEERNTRQCPPPPEAYPWLVFSHGRGFKNQTFHTISHSQNKNNICSSVRSVPELHNKFVWNSCHGWLILSNNDDGDQFSLFNPVTLESILLPPNKLDPEASIRDCTLSFPPSNPNCTLFVFDRGLRRILFCRLENKRWIAESYVKEIDAISGRKSDKDYLGLPVCCKGRLYASSSKSQLVSIDMVEQDTSHLVIKPLGAKLPSDYEQISLYLSDYLVESNGEIYCIGALYGGIRYTDINAIEIFKLDMTCLNWERVESIKDRVFFLCREYAVSCPAICTDQVVGGGGTCVYFTQVDDKSLYAYNIEDDSISVSLPCPNLPTPWKSPIWVMPDLRLINEDGRKGEHISEKEEQKKEEKEGNGEERKEVVGKEEDELKIEAKERLNLLDLPSEILKSITGLLMPVDYMKFRAVSTITRQLAPHIEWRTAMFGSDQRRRSLSSPWLISFEKNSGVFSLVDPNHNDKYHIRIPKSLKNTTLCHCKDGWLLMCQWSTTNNPEDPYQYRLIFFNPFTKETITYPAFPHLYFGVSQFGFSSSPSSSSCVVVVVSLFYGIYISRSREEEWSHFELESNPNFELLFMSIPIFANGAFYFMNNNGGIEVLRLEGSDDNDGCSWEILENIQTPCKSFNRNFLAECDGELLSIFITDLGKRVEIFKLNHFTQIWERVHSLRNRTLYISHSSAIAVQTKTPKMEEKIYLPRFCEQGIVSYSLASGMYHCNSGSEEGSLKDYYGTREQLFSGWIEPMWY